MLAHAPGKAISDARTTTMRERGTSSACMTTSASCNGDSDRGDVSPHRRARARSDLASRALVRLEVAQELQVETLDERNAPMPSSGAFVRTSLPASLGRGALLS